jgi:enoyl-[acyl-carrier-protein] reductase (NADH)
VTEFANSQLRPFMPGGPISVIRCLCGYARHALASPSLVAFEEMEKQYLEKVSLRRMVTPHDVAAMVLFLLSPMGDNLSGRSLGVDGNVETL